MFILPWSTLKQWGKLLGFKVVKEGRRYRLKVGVMTLVGPAQRPPFRRRVTKVIMKKIAQWGGLPS